MPWLAVLAVALGIASFACLAESARAGTAPCSLLSAAEASQGVGAPLGAGAASGPLNTACQWTHGDDYVNVQVVEGKDHWSPPGLAPGYKKVSGVGSEAYVAPELGGWSAAALVGSRVVSVSLRGPRASASSALALLRKVVARLS